LAALGLIFGVAGCGQNGPLAGNGVVPEATTAQIATNSHLALASTPQSGYAIGENTATANAGPVRLARVSYLSGPVTWRPNDSTEWSSATMNLPCRQGAQVWVKGGSRAELQFDDGSMMRLGGGAIATMPTMYSDDHGEFTEVKLNDGLATFHLRNKQSEYQIDTPLSSIKANGPAEVRVGVGSTVEVACSGGSAGVSGRQGEAVLHSRERLEIRDQTAPYQVTEVPEPDQWDQFNDNRDVIYSHHNQHVPSNIDLVAGDLDNYGTWHNDPHHGYVWAPRVHEAGWRPYHHGRWVWVSPWGWTWVGDEDWGYAPYHYGTWVDESYGWAWCPGPAVQYWSPGVVAYVDNGSYIGWAPLGPGEVRYPAAIDIGFHSGNWWLNFSIGGTAAYYPAGPSYCEARPWDNVYANREVNVYNVTNITNIYNNSGPGADRVFLRNGRFIPENGSRYSGMTTATTSAFLGGRGYEAPRADPRGAFFHNGRSFTGAPSNSQVFGPPNLRPGRGSFTPSRTFAKAGGPPQNVLQRSVVRHGVPDAIARNSAPIRSAFTPSRRQAAVVRAPILNRTQQQMRSTTTTTRAALRTHSGATGHVGAPTRTVHNSGNRAPTLRTPAVQSGLSRQPPVRSSSPRTQPLNRVRSAPVTHQQRLRTVTPQYHVRERTAPTRSPAQRPASRPPNRGGGSGGGQKGGGGNGKQKRGG